MTDAGDGEWWLAGNGQWHEGAPPFGWVQAGDRRWYPHEPPETATGYARKFESAHGRIATALALEAADADDAYEGDDLAWSSDYYFDAGPDDDGGIEDERRRPAWVLVGVLVVLLVAVVGVVGVMARTDDGVDETGPAADTAPPTSAPPGSTTATASTVESGPNASTVTSAPPPTPSTTVPPTSSTTIAPRPATTVPPPATTIAPPSTAPNPGGPPIRDGGRCSNVGATAIANNGTPVTCSTTDCSGESTNGPRWRRTNC